MSTLLKSLRWMALFAVLLVTLVALAVALLYGMTRWSASESEPMLVHSPTQKTRPVPADSNPREKMSPATSAERDQILFGDLHVHTNYSADAFLQSYAIADIEPRRTPADACDFARFCSQLDFWSINDHAENLSPPHWQATLDAVRECDQISGGAGNPNPDLVSFLGWEWSHASTAEEHYGHKNIVLADLGVDQVPTRPIGSSASFTNMFGLIGTVGVLTTSRPFFDYSSFHRYLFEHAEFDDCPDGIPSPDLPSNCRETATTPAALFRKLDEWNLRALVIPHGLSWANTNPAGAKLDTQLEQHDPKWQRLLEVYSGHGNSEQFVDFKRPEKGEDGRWSCPASDDGIELCCTRAATLARRLCDSSDSAACEDRVDEAVQTVAAIDAAHGGLGSLLDALPGTTQNDWGECGQVEGRFMPSFTYRPRMSAQYGLALGSVDGRPVDDRFRFGLIAASDTHRARPGTGYKEKSRLIMTDGVKYPMPADFMDVRNTSFYYSGGLTAAHAAGRDRESVFGALSSKRVYGTSGDRILLWFDLIDDEEERHGMGSEIGLGARDMGAFRFRARAVGAQEQRPGCPEFVHAALPTERVASLCRNECHHPSDERKLIERIEVIRVTPGPSTDETISQRIEDPWLTHICPPDQEGCEVEFSDPDWLTDGDSPVERAYYVRAVQAPSMAINGDPLRCKRDDTGRCLEVDICGELPDGSIDDCLGEARERAWSSPIFLIPDA